MDETSTSWGDWFQGVLGGVVNTAATAKWVQPYEIEKLKLQALGPNGPYWEGQRTTAPNPAGVNSTMMIMLGGLVVVALLLKK